MTTPAPDWADDAKALFRICRNAENGVTEPLRALEDFARTAYERGKAEGERLGYIKGLREAEQTIKALADENEDGTEYPELVSAPILLRKIRARIAELEQEADNAK